MNPRESKTWSTPESLPKDLLRWILFKLEIIGHDPAQEEKKDGPGRETTSFSSLSPADEEKILAELRASRSLSATEHLQPLLVQVILASLTDIQHLAPGQTITLHLPTELIPFEKNRIGFNTPTRLKDYITKLLSICLSSSDPDPFLPIRETDESHFPVDALPFYTQLGPLTPIEISFSDGKTTTIHFPTSFHVTRSLN